MITKSAIFSKCRTYRYSLSRVWNTSLPGMLWIVLNPSTATETEDDPTIRRCMRFAASWGYGGIVMCNLFAVRATDPKVMLAHPIPVGPENDTWVDAYSREVALIVAAWGTHGRHMHRDMEVMELLRRESEQGKIKCLKLTKDGAPWHPLYVKGDAKLLKYP